MLIYRPAVLFLSQVQVTKDWNSRKPIETHVEFPQWIQIKTPWVHQLHQISQLRSNPKTQGYSHSQPVQMTEFSYIMTIWIQQEGFHSQQMYSAAQTKPYYTLNRQIYKTNY